MRSRPLAEARGDGTGTGDSASPGRSSLITAVEIEKFKGIGQPVRVDLRPITLLFGRNSAGKSTILHALCYAHEILSHRSVDASKTELGGDQIDLGGFHTFVHGHDRDGTVRLRFELNLEAWRVPDPIWDKIVSPIDGFDDAGFWELSEVVKTGWVELSVDRGRRQPRLVSYEVGVNGALVGSLHATDRAGIVLEFDPAHPLLHGAFRPPGPFVPTLNRPNHETSTAHRGPDPEQVREAAGSTADGWETRRVPVYELTTPLPYWQELLCLNERELRHGVDHVDASHFRALVSLLLVGIGHDLHSELAAFRYIGPIRNLHPHREAESRIPRAAGWADGSAAWAHLHDSPRLGLIDNVSRWLAGPDRFDTGYALRSRSTLQIAEGDSQLFPAIREYHRLRERFGNGEGAVDLDGWARQQAANVVDDFGGAVRAATGKCHEIRKRFAEVTEGGRSDYFHVEVQEAAEGAEMVDQHLGHLRDLGSNDAIETRIRAPGADDIQASNPWTPEHVRRLAGMVARMDERDKCRDEIRQIKAQDDDCAKGLAECDRELAELSGGEQFRHEAGEDERVAKLRARIRGKVQERKGILKERKVTLEQIRALLKDKHDVLARGGNVDRIENQLKVAGIDEFRARVALARKEYRRLSGLVARMERRGFTSEEVDELVAAVAAGTPRRELQLVASATGLPMRTSDIGVGVSQILPVVVAALDPDRRGITAIEQPELHVHPRMQVELGDLFAQGVDRGGVFLIETHSEHLMLRLLRRIEETHGGELPEGKPPLKPDQVSVVFVEQVDREVNATPLRIDETGEFKDRWPHGFFEERDDELF